MDTGALHSSYIAKHVVDKFRRQMQSKIRSVNGRVKLGDNKTSIEVRERVTLPVQLTDWKGVDYIGMVDLCVMDMNDGLDMIIGLPDILRDYLGFLIDILEAARADKDKQDVTLINSHGGRDIGDTLEERAKVYSLISRYSDLVIPWEVEQKVETI